MKKIRNLILFSLLFFMPATSFAFTLAGIFSDKTSGGSTSRLEAWHTLITSAHTENHWQILNQVNQFINQARYVPDIRQWGEIDYWATPAEFLMSNAGDCEDYAIAKYYTLIAIGIPADKMRLTHVTINSTNEAHMVLLVSEKNTNTLLTLDNRNNEILPFAAYEDLSPTYSFNDDNLWITKTKFDVTRIGDAKQIKRWVRLKQRMSKESGLNSNNS